MNYTALKGVVSNVIEPGYEPYSETGVRTGKGQDFFEYTNEFPIYDNPAVYLPAGF